MKYGQHWIRLFATLASTALLAGCFTHSEEKQLTSINKDWNRIIRASHIQPVYPLTQDILPGDVFLVSHDIEDTDAWRQPGYLPLDHLVTRLYPEGYRSFYNNSWNSFTNPLPNEFLRNNSWTNAPIAGFPSYSFTVKQGGGASVALPIQGIPVGLSLMGAKQASGCVTLAEAHTYGIDEISLRKQVWEFVKTNKQQLTFLLPADRTNFLTVVTRVYAVGRVTVSMVNDSAKGGSLWGGSPKDVPIPNLTTTNPAVNFSNMLAAVNSSVPAATQASTVLPGGTLKFNAVSSRSVSMSETFVRPVIIGYNGFSFAISKKNKETNELGIVKSEILLGESVVSNTKALSVTTKGKTYITPMYGVDQSRLSKLLDDVDKLPATEAVNIIKNPPINDPDVEKLIAPMDPNNKRFTEPAVAKAMLKRKLVLSKKRSEYDLTSWETTFAKALKESNNLK